MKKKVLIMTLMLTFASAEQMCKERYDTAIEIMTARQNGVPAIKSMKRYASTLGGKAMVMDAYEEPAFQGKKFKKIVITEFGDKVYIECLRKVKN